ncbi:MAG TPA: AAA family ATPase [Planctomycetaceae bacterium]|jgi:type II secretory pathway predicted ATPase ExeA
MYEAYFNLPRRPFSATPDSSCFFATEAIQEIVDQLVLRAETGEGIGVVTGAAGTGKTLLCRRIAADLAPRMTPVFLANSNFPTRRALLQSILFELGRKYSGLEEQELRLAIFGMLRELTLVGHGAVIIVDEAHLLSDRLLEELRLLACLSEEGQPLARVILAGQPALEERLVSPRLEALNQRIACQLYLEPLTRRESIDYVAFRISWAGGQAPQMFNEGALDSIATAAAGLPRCLNQLCDHALLLTFVQEQPCVTAEIVAEALHDLQQLPLHWNTPVSGDLSVAALHETVAELESDVDPGDEVDVDEELPVVIDEIRRPSFSAETVCFEVGGDDEQVDPADIEQSDDYAESISLADDQFQSVVSAREAIFPAEENPSDHAQGRVAPSQTAITWQAILHDPTEELLVDRYATLDAKMPRLVRTFEDAPVPETWQPVNCSEVPPAPEPPELFVASGCEDVFPLESVSEDEYVVEPVVELRPLSEHDSTERDLDEKFGFLPEQPAETVLDAKSRFVESNRAEPLDIEDQFAASVLEACREVRSLVAGGWHEEDIPSPAGAARRSLEDVLEEVVLPESRSEFDVIEPDLPVNRQLDRDVVRDHVPPATQATGRYVPKPKYRMIFSTLRRRLGRGR